MNRLLKVLLLFLSCNVAAADFTVLALFPGKAMIKFEGKNILLKAGEEKNGFLLHATDPYKQTADIEINGKKETYDIGRHIGGGYAKPDVNEVRINAKQHGSFITNGRINGQYVNFVLDTGATSVSMNEGLARKLRLDYKNGMPVTVETASGKSEAYRVELDKVTVGSITLNNVDGLVLKGNNPEVTLLGMSFLGRLEIQQTQNLMVLRKKY